MKKIVIIVGALGILGALVFVVFNKEEVVTEKVVDTYSTVEAKTVEELKTTGEPVVAYGQVISANSVEVVSELSGVVKRVYKNLGDTVRAGEVVFELQNSSEQQGVLQANAQVSSAQANLSKSKQGTDVEDVYNQELDLNNKKTALLDKQLSIKQFAEDTHIAIINSVQSQYDQFFYDGTTDPQLKIALRDLSDTKRLENSREDLSVKINQSQNSIEQLGSISYTDTVEILDKTEQLIGYYDRVLNEYSDAISSQSVSIISEDNQEKQLATIRTIRQPILVLKSRVSSERVALQSAKNAIVISENNLKKLQEGPKNNDVSIAQSNLSSAESSRASAQIQLQKTRITAPTFGKISSINVRIGQLVGPSSPAFILSSSSAKRIDAYLSSSDVSRIRIGSKIIVDGKDEAFISRISPTIDQKTGKIKIEAFFSDDQVVYVEGTGVGLSISTFSENLGFSVPISSIFVRNNIPYVYIVTAENTISPREIKTGGLFGSNVSVFEGLTDQDKIVLNARGLKDNQLIKILGEEKQALPVTPGEESTTTVDVSLK